jgi:hypothetical protein
MGDEADALLRRQEAAAGRAAAEAAVEQGRFLGEYDTLCAWISQIVCEFKTEMRRRNPHPSYSHEVAETTSGPKMVPRVRVPLLGIVDESTTTGKAIAKVARFVFHDYLVE